MTNVIITVDLGYGDSGKGSIVDALTRQKKTGLVVRYSGGSQAAHNVVTPDGRHHTFMQFGSGSFVPETKTYLGPDMLVDIYQLLTEANELIPKGIPKPLENIIIHEDAPLITPFNIFINQTREIHRGNNRHGSCGKGIYETRLDSRAFGDALLVAGDITKPAALKEKLLHLREKKRTVVETEFPDVLNDPNLNTGIFFDDNFITETVTMYAEVAKYVVIDAGDILKKSIVSGDQVIFEAAQGVMIDETYGFLPYVTGSTVTTQPAFTLLKEIGIQDTPHTIGITRSYQVRHGAGPLVTEDPVLSSFVNEPHNTHNPWQGPIRTGWLDPVLLRYALKATGHVDGIALTCLDISSRLPQFAYCTHYEDSTNKKITNLPFKNDPSEEEMASLTKQTEDFKAVYDVIPHEDVSSVLHSELNVPVQITSAGHTALEKDMLW